MQYDALYVGEKNFRFISFHKSSFSVFGVFSPESTVLECPLMGDTFVSRPHRRAATTSFLFVLMLKTSTIALPR